ALSVPSIVMLKNVMKPKLLAIFVGIIAVGIIAIGYIFNIFSFLVI
ncbi:TPA: permease, partial [Clostridioides difficile]|nr:permease [Clostridioides difficile]HBG3255830.1 permease [Clostridioides difficile]HBY2729899.1 permease [Clostridioides difficile]HBY2852498.1 permease [Clostridioides difficile]HBY3406594.1 permease [Clostridioides difficile]